MDAVDKPIDHRHYDVLIRLVRPDLTALHGGREYDRRRAHDPHFVLWLAQRLALAWLAHLLGQGLVAFGVGRLNTSLAAVILCLEGVGAMAVGALFYAESRGPFDLVAVVLIVSGIALAQRQMAHRDDLRLFDHRIITNRRAAHVRLSLLMLPVGDDFI